MVKNFGGKKQAYTALQNIYITVKFTALLNALTQRHLTGRDITVLPGDGAVTQCVAPWLLVPIWISAHRDAHNLFINIYIYRIGFF